MIKISNGKVLVKVDGQFKETSNPELIGFAVLDAAEINKKERKRIDLVTNDHKRLLGIIDTTVEIELLDNYVISKMPFADFCLERTQPDFPIDRVSTQILVDVIEMIKAKKLILKPVQDEVAN